MNKRIRLNRIAAYWAAQVLLTFGLVLAVKADFGISVATSPSYVLSMIISSVSFGTFNYLYQGMVFLLMLLILKQIRLRFFFSFLTAVIFGYMIDLWMFLLRDFIPESFAVRLVLLCVSIPLMGFSITTFVVSGWPMLPFDIFVRKISAKYGFRFSRFKLAFDLSNLGISIALSLVFLGGLRGIGPGTLLSGVSLGPLIGLFLRFYDRFVLMEGRVPGFLTEPEHAF